MFQLTLLQKITIFLAPSEIVPLNNRIPFDQLASYFDEVTDKVIILYQWNQSTKNPRNVPNM